MNIWASALVVARRDFTSIVLTPTFLLFLLAPLLMIGFAALGGTGAGQLAQSAEASEYIVAIVPSEQLSAFVAADAGLRNVSNPPRLVMRASQDARIGALGRDPNVVAILSGSAERPRILERAPGSYAGRYLATLAETVARQGLARAADTHAASSARFETIASTGTTRAAQAGLGYGAVFALFLLSLLLGGQTVGMLAEEKGNKVIEIMAAAAPLEGVFLGKLLGMLGVALLFIAFWAALIGGGIALVSAQAPGTLGGLLSLTPAIGWPWFIVLATLYFLSAFLLLGSVFLGVGAQANTVREIQMLSLPITFFQVAMFSLASAAANAPGTIWANVAQWLPWSSPFAMAARGATDAALWPHVMALSWQALWIAITIALAVRLFRAGVLRSGGGLALPWRRKVTTPKADIAC
ncbi:MAG: ABC transporter permease [Sphingopyxis sp.]